jgi:uncharacterized protein
VEAIVEEILARQDTIAVVGASADPAKAAHRVPALMQGHGWRIVPVNLRGGLIMGERAHRTLAAAAAAGQPAGLVGVFRPSAQAADVASQAVAVGATALWLQLGIVSDEARAIAEGAGLLFVQNRCLSIERRRLGLDAPGPERGAERGAGPAEGRSR